MNEPMEPQFMAPPDPRKQFSEWAPTVEALKARSGEWAIILDGDDDGMEAERLASRIRNRRGVWGGETWEVTVRKVGPRGNRGYRVYARHVEPSGGGE